MLPTKVRGVKRVDDRRVLNGIFWRLRTGAPWADIPSRYGPHTTCVNRFNRWRKAGVWKRIQALSGSKKGILFIGSQGRGALEGAGVPIRRYWYRRSRYRIVTFFTFLASQIVLYRALARSREIPRDATVFVNTLLPFAAMLWGRRMGRRVVVHVHEASITPEPLLRFLTSCARHSADLLLYVSNDHRARLPIEGPLARIVPNPVNPETHEAMGREARTRAQDFTFDAYVAALRNALDECGTGSAA